MRSNSRTITVSYDQACLHDELFKENMAFQQCSDGDECKHFGPEKRTSAPQPQAGSFGGYGAVDTTCKKQTSRKRTVSFSPATCKIIHIDHQTEGLEHELWYSQSDFVFFEDQAWQCSQAVQECAARGSFDGDIGHILGLEKMLLCESYLDRRDALRNAVMDEHAIQSLAKEIRWRRRRGCYESDGRIEDIEIKQLAATSERNSHWAQERAFMAALALEHDLATCRAEEDLFASDSDLLHR
ncbi:hypothetical protein QTG54_008527 [Skeletonema marinoi]|uniref:Uncharacterized protein n=1 Tax=Skeletonema marinoi TaxID=267567 RepID=A0AAD8Y6J2_9STRA|nr:hypothetical protein QTG54_008527 [Skeletonema marinoi]